MRWRTPGSRDGSETPFETRPCGFESHTRAPSVSIVGARAEMSGMTTCPPMRVAMRSRLRRRACPMQRNAAKHGVASQDDPPLAARVPAPRQAARSAHPARCCPLRRRDPSTPGAYAELLGLVPRRRLHLSSDREASTRCASMRRASIVRDHRRGRSTCMRSCQARAQVASCPRSGVRRCPRRTGSTGRACFRSMGRGASTSGRSCWRAWQQRDRRRAHPEPLLRGLFHSDGCRITNWTVRRLKAGPKRYEYPRYLFSNESADIIGICADALRPRSACTGPCRDRNLLSVARDADVARLDTFIGPKS